MKKLEEEDFLKYECSENVKRAIDLERIHQLKLTEDFENAMKKQLKERLDKYTEFFQNGNLLLKEFLDIKTEFEIRKLLEKIEIRKKNQREAQQGSLGKLECANKLKPQESIKKKVLVEPKSVSREQQLDKNNPKMCKIEKCDIFKILKKIPVVTKQSRANKFIPRKNQEKNAGVEMQNTTKKKFCNKLNISKNSEEKRGQLPEYFFFKKFNEERKLDQIYENYSGK